MTPARTHDLLRLRPRVSLILDAPAPRWVAAFLMETPWVIVRGGIASLVFQFPHHLQQSLRADDGAGFFYLLAQRRELPRQAVIGVLSHLRFGFQQRRPATGLLQPGLDGAEAAAPVLERPLAAP